MRLTEFIRSRMDDILKTWERDAEAILAHRELSREQLRDHVEQILLEVCAELEGTEPPSDASSAFLDRRPNSHTSANLHGYERFSLGVDIVHVATEFRALRMTVQQLWAQSVKPSEVVDIDDLIRFHNEIDKAVTESIERYAQEKQKQGRLFETMLSSLPDPCYIVDLEGRLLYANRIAVQLCNVPRADIIGKHLTQLPLPIPYTGTQFLDKTAQLKEKQRDETEVTLPSGDIRWYEYVYTPVIDQHERVEAVACIAHDITARKEYEAQIWRHANYDVVTEVPNRRLFLDRLNQHAAHTDRTGAPFALLFIDLDHFKEINDRFGHEAGDTLLETIAQRITNSVRTSDTVARIGGDEFTVLLLDTGNPERVNEIANVILLELERPLVLERKQVSVSGSIGITLFPQDAHTADELLQNADKAMYFAKYSGRNRICQFSEIKEHERSLRQRLIRDLRDSDQSQHLRLHYQPIVELSTGRIAKAEALLRWQHPQYGLLEPDEFLPLAEETGLMSILEHWVFAHAAAQLELWDSRLTEPFQLTLNTSPLQFMEQQQEKPWTRHLETFARSKAGLVIELTENIFLHESDHLRDRFSELQQAGVKLALDDFGTGYSSMAYLKRFNISYLKIDRSFICHQTQSSNRTIAESIILMAHKLGLQVVAEGVETEEQRGWLERAGCDYAQGFLFAKPLSAEAFGELLEAGFRFD